MLHQSAGFTFLRTEVRTPAVATSYCEYEVLTSILPPKPGVTTRWSINTDPHEVLYVET